MDWIELLAAFFTACLLLIVVAIIVALFVLAISFGPIGVIIYMTVLLLLVITGLIYTGEI